ncbi:MAG: cobalamin-binding protein [bacterium (Candidatus Ratteibacteria) CG_4_10_14_3_um_filter_41_18]|uniref:Cobalamin-binding protein n=4 Tax=Candidatus Ratteibacteria TaxID=2979319 RepID=A0A2M7YEN7_9BACT|nr:MAG: methyltransferase [Candidatus Omnitrophica bacterium CG1_02_41_171]PIV64032.1 MAG: cobalamin-binding protein [bacterium (Candidatus Ratteibacteria) CG01_land_8_20_14_3_00_40_19]PIW33009.1 MAG: cobalamin-binding protein [bacterium (Candidatus Ratteibacteria) CG15_BIG_FIL_POST_REV_8_21_14_020_41_12]PIW73779.1 MAG: cobalamin-binding protein [bacterium (Candidatus Ratteibacteria) CG_4_8_14_3_um_filter_41_36]PIX77263.1 MAG: cobalamin-binding protein [bacterium (Candidatus Ratteibacteria) CG_
MADLEGIKESLIKGDANKVKELVGTAVKENALVGDILNQGLIAGMNVVGTKFKNNEFYVPEVLIAARAMHAGMEILEPLLEKSGIKPIGKIAVGTAKGDLHDIGKNLVIMMLKGGGFQVEDLGIDVAEEKFVETAKAGTQLIGISALLTTTMPSMKTVVEALKAAGLKDRVKVMIGGAPITQAYADEIGADGYSPDAASAVDKAKELLEIK